MIYLIKHVPAKLMLIHMSCLQHGQEALGKERSVWGGQFGVREGQGVGR